MPTHNLHVAVSVGVPLGDDKERPQDARIVVRAELGMVGMQRSWEDAWN